VATNYSPKIVSDSSLQFHVDTGNTKSWKGPPTSNYFYTPTPNSDGSVGFSVNGTGTFYRIYSGTYGGYTIQPSDVVYKYNLANQSGCYYHGNDFALAGGNTCTWSFQYYVSPDAQNYGVSPGNNFISNLEGNIGAGFYANDLRQGVWENFNSGPLYINSTGTGRVLIYPGACNGTYMATSGFILFKNPQFELLPYATSFVQSNSNSAGTRSATQCLLDLTSNNVTTDVTNAGYDSNGNITFNGSSNMIIGPENSVFNTQTFTMECWCNPASTTQSGFLFEKGNVNTQYSNFFNSDGTFYFRTIGLSNQDLTINAPSFINTNSWNHIVCSYNGSAKYIYVNGVLRTYTPCTGTSPTNANGISIGVFGGYNGSRAYYFNGKIAISRFYNKGLTQDEVLQNFNAQRSRFGV